MSSQDEEGGAGHPFGGAINHFEPIPHDHDFCERVVINVSAIKSHPAKPSFKSIFLLQLETLFLELRTFLYYFLLLSAKTKLSTFEPSGFRSIKNPFSDISRTFLFPTLSWPTILWLHLSFFETLLMWKKQKEKEKTFFCLWQNEEIIFYWNPISSLVIPYIFPS